ncbi:sensor domain-containing protein [Streptomyces sp. NBC_00237]|uniref:sensor histidine kinase n=1 Tax=Streptomyces sp. NBC_00237 TaxID=2975687 RepID=UPI00224CC153|nr:sensor histidine kinase [Streptomyces sp. NBC_00237]MCX5201345.1 sensor domain-containing protein [Streptomyces sp. NBC_00237]
MRRHLKALLHSFLAPPLALVGALLVLVGLLAGAALSVTALGPWLIAATLRGASGLASVQRALAQSLLGVKVEVPAAQAAAPGPFGWRRAVLADQRSWRAVGWVCLAPVLALPGLVVAFNGYVYGALFLLHPLLRHVNYTTVLAPDGSEQHVSLSWFGTQMDTWPRWLAVVAAGALMIAVAPRLVRLALLPYEKVLRALLGPGAADRRIRTLEETRAQAVEDAAATLRRIERDLHDGTQARLVGLGMHLTMIRELVAAGASSEQVLAVVETAQGNAKQAVADLRNLVKGIHPPVLDQGLDVALATLAADSPMRVEVRVGVGERPSPAIEAIAYFCVAELLANAAKHSGADAVDVEVVGGGGVLSVVVRDDGRGGAIVGAGSGLRGLLGRVGAVDGTLECDSPAGGPTVVRVVLPYR